MRIQKHFSVLRDSRNRYVTIQEFDYLGKIGLPVKVKFNDKYKSTLKCILDTYPEMISYKVDVVMTENKRKNIYRFYL